MSMPYNWSSPRVRGWSWLLPRFMHSTHTCHSELLRLLRPILAAALPVPKTR